MMLGCLRNATTLSLYAVGISGWGNVRGGSGGAWFVQQDGRGGTTGACQQNTTFIFNTEINTYLLQCPMICLEIPE